MVLEVDALAYILHLLTIYFLFHLETDCILNWLNLEHMLFNKSMCCDGEVSIFTYVYKCTVYRQPHTHSKHTEVIQDMQPGSVQSLFHTGIQSYRGDVRMDFPSPLGNKQAPKAGTAVPSPISFSRLIKLFVNGWREVPLFWMLNKMFSKDCSPLTATRAKRGLEAVI